jgi:membrane-anchored protein YejM (alkaline phosphatase superfamily)
MFDGLMAQGTPLATNIYTPLEQVVREIKSPARADRHLCSFDVRHRYQTETDLQDHAFQVLHTDQADLVFLHFAVPHSPNIWSRIRNDYTQSCNSSYLDNLALADRVLGNVLGTLKGSPRWNQTTLIVQGDHSWRIDAWNWLPAWTQEDDDASRGVFDQRPAMIIHQPAQNQAQTVSTPWHIIRIHDVVEQTIHGRPLSF